MLLTIDLGNTNLTIGLYEGETLIHHWRLATEDARMPDEYGLQFLGLLTSNAAAFVRVLDAKVKKEQPAAPAA